MPRTVNNEGEVKGGGLPFSGKTSGPQWALKRNLLPELTSLAEPDTYPGAS